MLFQEVKFLENYVNFAVTQSKTVPFIVRLQMTSLPFARNQPYDLFADIAFLPDFKEDGADVNVVDAPHVVPLFSTDNVNVTQRSRAVELARALTLALLGTGKGVSGQADFKVLSDDLKSVLGRDFQFTIARLSDSTVRVRLGAAAQPDAGVSMFPRTHNATLLLLVPESYFERNVRAKVSVFGRFFAVHALTGKKLEVGMDEEQWSRALAKIIIYGKCSEKTDASDAGQEMMKAVTANQWKRFNALLEKYKCDKDRRQPMWLEMIKILQKFGMVTAAFELDKNTPVNITELAPAKSVGQNRNKKQSPKKLNAGK
ncbi:hypothetical protein CCP2SC5_590003 [Azospirillaceae bacterium]